MTLELAKPIVSPVEEKEDPIEVLWEGPAYDLSGYGHANRGYLTALWRKGVHVQLKPDYFYRGAGNVQPPKTDVKILNAMERNAVKDTAPKVMDKTPEFYEITKENKKRPHIGMTVFELTGIPPLWVEHINDVCEELWLPNTFNEKIFKDSGVEKPIFLVPHGIDTKRFNPKVKPLELANKKGFTFLSVFQWTPRKGPDVLFKAYFKEFSADDDVCLLVRAFRTDSSYAEQCAIRRGIYRFKREFAPNKKTAKVIFMGENLPDNKMPALYNTADCFVLPSRGEGWNMPAAEALACAVPVITTDWGGHKCFLDKRNSYLIKVDEFKITKWMEWIPWYNSLLRLRWAEPSVKDLQAKMREVFECSDRAKKRALRGRRKLQTFSWKRAANIIIERLKKYQ